MIKYRFLLTTKRAVVLGASLLGVSAVWADSVQTTEPTISVGSVTSSNPQLFATNAKQGSAVVATLDLPFEWRNDTLTWTTTPLVRFGTGSGDAAVSKSVVSLGSLLENKTERSDIEKIANEVVQCKNGTDHRAIRAALEHLERMSQKFAARRMNRSIRQALTGHRVTDFEEAQ